MKCLEMDDSFCRDDSNQCWIRDLDGRYEKYTGFLTAQKPEVAQALSEYFFETDRDDTDILWPPQGIRIHVV